MLNKDELIRYQRQLQLQELGMAGQQKLKRARVIVVGAGGLGCAVLQYLVAAGVGKIGIVDFDTVAASNLQRQVIYTTEDIGNPKVDCAIRHLSNQNKYIELQGFPVKLNNKNAIELFSGYDIVIDGTDNYSTRYLVNDACVLLDKPLIYGAVYRFEGQVSVFNHTVGHYQGPTYRCLFPEPPVGDALVNCSETGVLGILPGMIGIMQANEAIKLITGIGELLSGKLIVVNGLTMESKALLFERNSEALKGIPTTVKAFEEYDYNLFCNTLNINL